MRKFSIGQRVKVVADEEGGIDTTLIGDTGIVTKYWPDGSLSISLDDEPDEGDLWFQEFELEVVLD